MPPVVALRPTPGVPNATFSILPPAVALKKVTKPPEPQPSNQPPAEATLVWQELCQARKREKLMAKKMIQLKKELSLQKKVNSGLKQKLREVGSKKHHDSLVRAAFLERFSVARTNFYMSTGTRSRWTQQEIIDGLMIHGFSIRAYKYLTNKKLLPLPALSTLRSWMRDFPCRPGIETDLLDFLSNKLNGRDLPDDYRDCILSFDDTPLKSNPVKNSEQGDANVPGSKKLLLVVLRGLFHEWRMPIFYDFDRVICKTLLLEIISAIESHGARVRGVAGVLINHSLMTDFKLGPSNPCVEHPSNPGRKIYFFPDVPFMFKSLRNKLLEPGLVWPDGTELSRRDFEPLLKVSDSGVRAHPKLTREHIDFLGRVTVKLTAELMSHTTASVMRDLSPKKATEAAFIELVDSW